MYFQWFISPIFSELIPYCQRFSSLIYTFLIDLLFSVGQFPNTFLIGPLFSVVQFPNTVYTFLIDPLFSVVQFPNSICTAGSTNFPFGNLSNYNSVLRFPFTYTFPFINNNLLRINNFNLFTDSSKLWCRAGKNTFERKR